MHKDMVVIRIPGSKVGTIDNSEAAAPRGIEWRLIAVHPDLHAGTRFLADLVATNGGKPVEVKASADGLGTDLRRVGREALPKKMIKDAEAPGGRRELIVSPYSFRHAMACDLKSCDELDDVTRAQVMGHLSVESIASYGRRRRGGGGQRPIEAVKSSATPHRPAHGQADSPAAGDRPRG